MKLYLTIKRRLKDCRKYIYDTHIMQVFPFSMGMLHYLFFCFMIFSVFRLRLFIERYEDIKNLSLAQHLEIFWMGFRLDGVIVGYTSVLLVLFLLLFPRRWEKLHMWVVTIYTSLFYMIFITAEISSIYFFRYFDFRPNYLVLDHWKDFQLVETVLEAYPVPLAAIAIACLFAGVFYQQKLFSPLCYRPIVNGQQEVLQSGWKDRSALFLIFLLCGLMQRGTVDHRALNPSASAITKNRVANEIANSGVFNVVYEGIQRVSTKYIPVKSVIPTLGEEDAIALVKDNFGKKGTLTNDSSNPLVTHVFTERPRKDMNVVVIVMESLAAKLLGTLGGNPAVSPEFDRIAEESVLFENCYATGERTIQGLEAVLCSFPPLPGVGIVRRPQAKTGFTTLASVLKERGYQTMFLYGGQGIFDHKIGFFLGNGYDTFLEEKDFENPIYKSPWGASDEDLYQRGDKMFTQFTKEKKPFFCTILTSSLHSPWVYPEGRVEPMPKDVYIPPGYEYNEINNFKYADWALGEFFKTVKKSNYYKNTIFVVVGDHGVHLRGNELIPVNEYRVGAIIHAPNILEPVRITRTASQLDIAPTILGLLGGTYRSTFFGTDIFRKDKSSEYALMVYDKKRYGIVYESMFTVLGEKGQNYAYRRNSNNGKWNEAACSEDDKKNADLASSILQVAEKLLQEKKYHINMDISHPF